MTATLCLHVAAFLAMDVTWPRRRDPEYGLRAPQLRDRLAEHRGRPLVLVVGTSRSCMGVKPDAWEAVRPGGPDDPLLFNLSTVGAGPIQQLITVRRVYADGFRPAVVLLEFWPPPLRQDGRHAEQVRMGHRLRYDDLPVVRGYFSDPDRTERDMLESRLNPLAANRHHWVCWLSPNWLPPRLRDDVCWRGLDGWGWLPGMDVRPDDAATRRRLTEHHRPGFRDRFDGHTIHPGSDRALREAVEVARAHGSLVGLVYLPESSEFQSWYPAGVEEAARDYLLRVSRELGLPVIDARDWVDDRYLADGFHLSRVGAGVFTERLGAALTATFPAISGRP